MDGFELNKILGASTGALLVFLSINTFAEAMFHPGGHGEEHANYYATEETGGEAGDGGAEEQIDMAALIQAASAEDGAKVFKKCASCHKAEQGAGHGQGPALYGVMGRDIASVDGFAFSEALTSKEGAWDWEKLDHFLAKPADWAPGTRMKFAGLKKPEQRAEVMVYLNQQSGSPVALPTPAAAPAEAPAEAPQQN